VGGRQVEANQVASQVAVHAATGGIVPEVAAREQLRWIVPTLEAALAEAGRSWADLDAVAVTYGPGLIGSLLVGVNVAKAIAVARGLPLIGVNHIEGHIYANWLVDAGAGADGEAAAGPAAGADARAAADETLPAELLPAEPPFPLLCLVVSGGHSQLVLMHDHGRYQLLGQTVDDAAGEAFDKVGRLLGLPYPGGPAISTAATRARAVTRFPRARTGGRYDFSFSGLKTAVLREVESYRATGEPIPVDGLAAAFEEAVVDALVGKTVAAAQEAGVQAVALGGGVAANRALRATLRERLGGIPLLVPRPEWCTDNGAMIGAAAGYRYLAGDRADATLEAIPSLALPWMAGDADPAPPLERAR
jgi:N6-L-threonylcarbamoyladenine synthase